jgi:hypothetical protein
MPTQKNHPNVTKTDVVVLALADAGGATKVVDTEDVAVEAHRLAPAAFSWKKYPEQIAIDSVRVHLYDGKKVQHGTRVGGSLREGWHLTSAGRSWVEEQGAAVRAALGLRGPATREADRPESRQAEFDRRRMRSSRAFTAWSEGQPLRKVDAEAVLRLTPYATAAERETKVGRFEAAAGDDQELVTFVEAVATLLRGEEGTPTQEDEHDG